jgi:hypothetical protein
MSLDLTRRSTKGSPLSAEDHDGNLDKLEGAIELPLVRGQCSKMTNGTISGLTQGAYVSTGLTATFDTNTAEGIGPGTVDLFALKNISGATKLMRFYGSIDAQAGNNQTLGIKLAKNGVAIDETECRAFTASGGAEAKLVTSWMISMASGDEIALMVANHSAATDITLKRARLLASEVR